MRERVCKNCGGRNYKVVGQNMVKCQFCGTLYVDESASKEEEFLIVGANEKVRDFKFKEAVSEYDKILSLYPMSFEAFFRKALAKNKIIFYTNKRGTSWKPRFFGKEIPSLIDDEDFKSAVANAPAEIAKAYYDKAKRIEKIRKLYLDQASKQTYDLVLFCMDYDKNDTESYTYKLWQQLISQGISTYFVQGLEQKEKEEETFIALQTCKALIFVANAKKGYTDGEVKNIYDRYLYFISQKQKTKSSFLIAIDQNKISFEELPNEIAISKNLFDLNSISFLQDIDVRLKKELKNSVNETAKIETVAVEKVAPVKKTYIDLESVEPSELGHYHVENTELSETNKIKWIFLTLKHGDFKSANELVAQELEKDPNNAELLFAELLALRNIKTEEEFFSNIANFRDKEKIDNILGFATKDFAEYFVDSWENLIISLDSEEYYNAFLLYLAKFDTPNRQNFIQKAENKAIDTLNDELIEKVLKCFKNTEVDRFVDFYFMLAQKSDNQEYYQKVLEIDEGHEQSNLALLLQHYKSDEDKLTYRNKSEIEEVFKFLSEDTRAQFVLAVVNLVMPIAFYDLNEAQRQLDFYLAYVSNNEKLVEILKTISFKFQEMGFFKQAEKYVTIAIAKTENKADLYWKLIQIKAHCKTDNELIFSNVKTTQFPEWETLLNFADEKQTEKYAEIASKVNLYNGERQPFKPDMLDKKEIVEKLKEFVSRNDKILLEMEGQEGQEVVRGVDYYRLQLKPFEKYIEDITIVNDFKDFQEIMSKIEQRLEALDLTLESSVNVVNLLDKDDGLKNVYQPKETKNMEHAKQVKDIKKDKFLKKFLYFFLELFPLVFTTLLLFVLIFLPKEVYMYFSLEFLVVSLIISVAVGMVNLVVFINKRHTMSKWWNIADMALFCIAGINLLLLCFGFYFTPKTIEIDNAHQLKVLLRNASHANFILSTDIDLKDVTWESISFTGNLNGNNHKISNIKFSSKEKYGFFKTNSGIVENLEFELSDCVYRDVSAFGTVASKNYGTISNCKVSGNINIDANFDAVIGGLAGTVSGGTVENCENNLNITISISADNLVVGGLVGEVASGKEVSKIYRNKNNVNMNLIANDAGLIYSGGLVGFLRHIEPSSIDISQNASSVSMTASGYAVKVVCGGLIGQGYSQSENNYSLGKIGLASLTAGGYVGGLYGQYENSDLTSHVAHSYSSVKFEVKSNITCGALVGGLGGKLDSCFTTIDRPLIGEYKTTPAEDRNCKKLLSSFYDESLGFDTEIWDLSQEKYPTLKGI